MKLEFIPKFIMLIAGAVVSVITIAKNYEPVYSLELLFGTLVIFYLLGLIVKWIVQKTLANSAPVQQMSVNQKSKVTEIPERKEEKMSEQENAAEE